MSDLKVLRYGQATESTINVREIPTCGDFSDAVLLLF